MLTQQYENNSIYPWSFLGIFRWRSNKLFQCTNLHNTGWSIMISSFQIISRPSSNYQPWMTFEVRNWKYMENTLKIKVFRRSILFCKYLRNEILDLHEILYGGQLLSCELMFQISWRSVHKCARTSCKRSRAHFIASAHVYDSCARIYAWIFMKFET